MVLIELGIPHTIELVDIYTQPHVLLLALTLVRDPRSCSSRSGALAIVKGSRS
jgi:hypothetical protein